MTSTSKESFFFLLVEIITDIGTTLFYQFCGAMDESVMSYQPTMQFFTSCVEMLGKVSKTVAVIKEFEKRRRNKSMIKGISF